MKWCERMFNSMLCVTIDIAIPPPTHPEDITYEAMCLTDIQLLMADAAVLRLLYIHYNLRVVVHAGFFQADKKRNEIKSNKKREFLPGFFP